jgi:hypothetical protein
MPGKHGLSSKIRWPNEWRKKSLHEVQEFLQRIMRSGKAYKDLSERDQDFFDAITEK